MRHDGRGSIYPTAPTEETSDYNVGNDTLEFFIVTDEEWPT